MPTNKELLDLNKALRQELADLKAAAEKGKQKDGADKGKQKDGEDEVPPPSSEQNAQQRGERRTDSKKREREGEELEKETSSEVEEKKRRLNREDLELAISALKANEQEAYKGMSFDAAFALAVKLFLQTSTVPSSIG